METRERKKKGNELYEQEMTGALENVYGKQYRLDKEKNRKVKEDEILREESLLPRESEIAIKEAEIIRFNIEQSTEISILSFSILLIVGLIILYFSYFLISTVLKEIFFSINPNLIELYKEHEILGQGIMIALVTLIVVYIPFPIYKRIWKRWLNFRIQKKIKNWKKQNPNHRAYPYI